ncbi:hypothetical protein FRB94_007005 [Tulasnella sp. JGI-2019a]|nr:hypothetical protein FRB93_007282 [Tulasnella sp. JGI-2019a]KAG8998226.1 hypothetical protein FRB94_007005 [Tulasnella sp. JGI-2019a]KAG9028243.1 hypothetical protein FRB95_006649 [Tulasnella sp. JGI-2019a]
MASAAASCLFCKIIKGEIPSLKILETELSYAFMDINPLAKGHSLIIPKFHAEKLHEVPDESLADVMPIAKKIALAIGSPDYNILQNNGAIAHQVVKHVHFHVIPKPAESDKEGLVIGWPQQKLTQEQLQEELSKITAGLTNPRL